MSESEDFQVTFIRPGMTVEEQLKQWITEYKKLWQERKEERARWEQERSEGLLLLNDYRRDNKQLETEKRQWEQEREFGFKLVENLRHRVDHYIVKIKLIEHYYNIDIEKFDSTAFIKELHKDHMAYDPTKIDYINSEDYSKVMSKNASADATSDPAQAQSKNEVNAKSFLTIHDLSINGAPAPMAPSAEAYASNDSNDNDNDNNNNNKLSSFANANGSASKGTTHLSSNINGVEVENLYDDELDGLNLTEQARKVGLIRISFSKIGCF
ncbi:hypothetical protein RFI_27849 [Reticulomyxa filosa]|uniref:Uncharacterized protein n=1 Tax=Reticulomyxa filosa TaxID=46433 RepID=X6M6A3_RETFI|nr:hypothetical protein RFI_27849 [Reticulomyxa filosa]|eukprot:ETO09523.1 hypothetical protein RFI_27849 [Reticulomyxa filosa]